MHVRRRAIAGAVLDVFTTEPLPPEHPFWDLDNVIVTPHIAGPSTPEEIAPVFAENLTRYLAGRPLRHVVDRRRAITGGRNVSSLYFATFAERHEAVSDNDVLIEGGSVPAMLSDVVNRGANDEVIAPELLNISCRAPRLD